MRINGNPDNRCRPESFREIFGFKGSFSFAFPFEYGGVGVGVGVVVENWCHGSVHTYYFEVAWTMSLLRSLDPFSSVLMALKKIPRCLVL